MFFVDIYYLVYYADIYHLVFYAVIYHLVFFSDIYHSYATLVVQGGKFKFMLSRNNFHSIIIFFYKVPQANISICHQLFL